MSSGKKEIISTLIILLINALIVAFAFLFSFLIEYSSKVDFLFLKILFYIVICIVTFQISKRIKSKFFEIIAQILYLPMTIFALLSAIAIPVLTIQLSIFLYLAFSFIFPMILFRLDQNYQLTILNIETWTYLILTSGVIFAFLFHHQLKYIVQKVIPFIHQESERVKKFKLIELNDYVISINNIRFVIFSLYLIYVFIVNIMSFQNASFYENPNIDKAVLQSFVSFIAFDRVLATLKLTEFRPSKLLNILKESVRHVFQ